jgi:hypothetical protein
MLAAFESCCSLTPGTSTRFDGQIRLLLCGGNMQAFGLARKLKAMQTD